MAGMTLFSLVSRRRQLRKRQLLDVSAAFIVSIEGLLEIQPRHDMPQQPSRGLFHATPCRFSRQYGMMPTNLQCQLYWSHALVSAITLLLYDAFFDAVLFSLKQSHDILRE